MASPAKIRLLMGTLLFFTLARFNASAQKETATGHPVSSGASVKDAAPDSSFLLDTMTGELQRAFTSLGKPGPNRKDADKQLPPYFLSYSVATRPLFPFARNMAHWPTAPATMYVWRTCRCASAIPSSTTRTAIIAASAVNSMQLPLGRRSRGLGAHTLAGYQCGLRQARSTTFSASRPKRRCVPREEDTSPDFSQEAPQVSISKPAPPVAVDRAAWEQRVKAL